ncbi:MAG: TetR/AcrR family transcriptional regulator [Rikenellaceae bacterium]
MTIEQREIIVELSSKMFSTEGIKSVRMDDIAHRAGISKRTLYETFTDKESLIYLAIKHHFGRKERESERVGERASNIIIAFLLVAEESIRNSEVDWKLYNDLRKFYPAIYTRLREENTSRHLTSLKRGLEYGVENGFLDRSADLDLAIFMITTVAGCVVMNENMEIPLPSGMSPQKAVYDMTIYFLRGIATKRGIEEIDNYVKNHPFIY